MEEESGPGAALRVPFLCMGGLASCFFKAGVAFKEGVVTALFGVSLGVDAAWMGVAFPIFDMDTEFFFGVRLSFRMALDVLFFVVKGLGVATEAGLGVATEAGLGVATEAGLGVATEAGLGVATEAGLGVATEAGLGVATEAGLGVATEAGLGVATEAGLGVATEAGLGVATEAGLGVATEAGLEKDFTEGVTLHVVFGVAEGAPLTSLRTALAVVVPAICMISHVIF